MGGGIIAVDVRSLLKLAPDVVTTSDALVRARIRAAGAVVLAYHDVTDDADTFTMYSVSPRRFRQQLELALRWDLQFVDLATLADRAERGDALDGMAAVCFDDCLEGLHRHAFPILADLRVPATLFVVSGALGSVPHWWPGSAPVMTKGELLEMHQAGFGVACHTRSHPSLPGVTDGRLRDELSGSRQDLEDLVQEKVDLLAYPFGHHDPRVREAVRECGFRAAFTFLNGRMSAGLDPFRLPRINMHEGLNAIRLAHHLSRAPERWPDTQPDAVDGDPEGARPSRFVTRR